MAYISEVGISLFKGDFEEMIRRGHEADEQFDRLMERGELRFYPPSNYDSEKRERVSVIFRYVNWNAPAAKFVDLFLSDKPHAFRRVGECWNDVDSEEYDAEFLYDLVGVCATVAAAETEDELGLNAPLLSAT